MSGLQRVRLRALITVITLASLIGACAGQRASAPPTVLGGSATIGAAAAHLQASTDPVVIAAGDIASCSSNGDEQTAALVTAIDGTVITLGDNAYESGTTSEYNNCYGPSWGAVKARTRPSPGNHEYNTPGASGYYGYFGVAAGSPAQGWYSFDVGGWHLIALNSNCGAIGGCGAGSPQEQWLRTDLAAHPAACTLAYWHHPRFSSGPHGAHTSVGAIWQALYDYGADVVLNGHDHDYERFAPQDPAGAADAALGIREFVVGTGGRSHYATGTPLANSEVRSSDTYGALALTLHASGYDWQFVPVAGATFTDNGSGACHGPALPDGDGDWVPDSADNCPADTNLDQANNDGNYIDLPATYAFDDATLVRSDEAGDACDPDDDNDGLADSVEAAGPPCASASGMTDPLALDSDIDAATDGAECALGSDPTQASSRPAMPSPVDDPDHDGLATSVEAVLGSNPAAVDTDGDRLGDGVEFKGHGSAPTSANTDGDGCGDAREAASVNADEAVTAADLGLVAASFGTASTSPSYVEDFDVSRDGVVTAADLGMVAAAFGPCP
jgi:hypothetical protein